MKTKFIILLLVLSACSLTALNSWAGNARCRLYLNGMRTEDENVKKIGANLMKMYPEEVIYYDINLSQFWFGEEVYVNLAIENRSQNGDVIHFDGANDDGEGGKWLETLEIVITNITKGGELVKRLRLDGRKEVFVDSRYFINCKTCERSIAGKELRPGNKLVLKKAIRIDRILAPAIEENQLFKVAVEGIGKKNFEGVSNSKMRFGPKYIYIRLPRSDRERGIALCRKAIMEKDTKEKKRLAVKARKLGRNLKCPIRLLEAFYEGHEKSSNIGEPDKRKN